MRMSDGRHALSDFHSNLTIGSSSSSSSDSTVIQFQQSVASGSRATPTAIAAGMYLLIHMICTHYVNVCIHLQYILSVIGHVEVLLNQLLMCLTAARHLHRHSILRFIHMSTRRRMLQAVQ
jgi:hypothetical protein